VAHIKTVRPGISDAGNTAVEGINPGDVLADSSFDKLQDNAHVTVANTPAPAPAAPDAKAPPAKTPPKAAGSS